MTLIKRYIVILLLFVVSNSFSITYYSIIDGNWDDGATWSTTPGGVSCSCVPDVSNDIIYIQSDVILDVNLTNGGGNEGDVGGSIIIDATFSLKSTTKNISFKTGSHLIVNGDLELFDLEFDTGTTVSSGVNSSIIVHGDLINRNNSDDVTINGTIDVSGEFSNGNGDEIIGSGSITASAFTGSGTTFGLENGTIAPGATIPNSLPINLLSFDGKKDGDSISLTWSTSSEINNEFFTIERSSDGLYFETVNTVSGSGNSDVIINYKYMIRFLLKSKQMKQKQ